MRLSREVTILSRIVSIVCWDKDEQKVGGQGSRTNTYSIKFLSKRGVLEHLDSAWARTVRCDWAREDWREDDGVIGASLDQDAVDNILFMVEQYLGGPTERDDLEADANTHGLAVWIDALDFLSAIGVVDIFERQVVSVAREEADRLGRTGRPSPLQDPQTYPTRKARVINFDHVNRRYPPAESGED